MSQAAKTVFNLYRKTLYVVLPFTTCVGFSSGLVEIFTGDTKASALSVFSNVIGYTTLGAATGITYPLTFPVIVNTVVSN